MRTFYEEWISLDNCTPALPDNDPLNLAPAGAKFEISNWNLPVPNLSGFPLDEFLSIGFSHHRTILSKVKEIEARLFYVCKCAKEKMSREELGIRDRLDLDERVVENAIIHNVKNFILTFGKDFAFIRNQYHLDAFGEDQYIDLLFFNRSLNCLVAVELKTGKFKTSYLGQLQGYLSILDGFERKPHENPSIGLILCKDMNKSFVDYVIQDYSKPMGVATYKTSKDMSEELRKALPDIEDLKKLLNQENE